MSSPNKHVVSKEFLQNKPLSKFEVFSNFVGSDKVVWLFGASLVVLLFLPMFFPPVALIVHLFIYFRSVKRTDFPFFAPVSSGEKVDYFNKSPIKGEQGEITFKEAAGIAYFGNVHGTNEQAWFSNSMLRQHIAFLATTGSGKTYTISGMASGNALIWGAGYMFIDAKADLDIIRMHESLMWRTNRIDDCFILNYIRGGRNRNEYASDRTTNTYNMLEKNSAAQNTETMKSLMQGDGDIWSKRADSLLSGLLRPTHFLRDEGRISLSIPALLDYLVIETAGSLLSDETIPDGDKKELLGFIKTLPGMSNEFFNKISRGESVQSPQVYDQWGFASMQIILVVNTLGGDYADIFGVKRGEIDMEAIVTQDRIFLGLLPALEGSTESVASMGRIIMAARKGVMGQALGERYVGSVAQNLKNRPTNAPYPFINVMDEVGMMFSQGEGAVAAQARGLGFSAWYSAQDVPAMKKLGESVASEVDTVMGNTVIKVAGRIIDDDTFELFSKLADQQYVWQRDGIDLDYKASNGAQRQTESRASYKEESRLDRREVQRLTEGEVIINAVDRLHRIDGPSLHPKSLKFLTINDFWMMLPYSYDETKEMNDEWVFLQSEYELVINEQSTLNEVDVSIIQDVQKVSKILDISKRVVGNQSSACLLGYAAYMRTGIEEMRALNQQKEAHFDSLYNVAPHRNETESLPPQPSNDNSILQEMAAQKNEDEKGEIVRQEDEFSIQPTPNTQEATLGTEQETTPTTFAVSPAEQSSTEATDKDAGANGFAPTSRDDFVNELDAQEYSERQEELHALDAVFKSQGVTKQSTVDSLAQISALSKRAQEVKELVDLNNVSLEEATERMHKPVSSTEVRQHATRSSSLVSEMYSKTEHPMAPTPRSNSKLAVTILKKIKLNLAKSIEVSDEVGA